MDSSSLSLSLRCTVGLWAAVITLPVSFVFWQLTASPLIISELTEKLARPYEVPSSLLFGSPNVGSLPCTERLTNDDLSERKARGSGLEPEAHGRVAYQLVKSSIEADLELEAEVVTRRGK